VRPIALIGGNGVLTDAVIGVDYSKCEFVYVRLASDLRHLISATVCPVRSLRYLRMKPDYVVVRQRPLKPLRGGSRVTGTRRAR
jgi:hypothetical protein